MIDFTPYPHKLKSKEIPTIPLWLSDATFSKNIRKGLITSEPRDQEFYRHRVIGGIELCSKAKIYFMSSSSENEKKSRKLRFLIIWKLKIIQNWNPFTSLLCPNDGS